MCKYWGFWRVSSCQGVLCWERGRKIPCWERSSPCRTVSGHVRTGPSSPWPKAKQICALSAWPLFKWEWWAQRERGIRMGRAGSCSSSHTPNALAFTPRNAALKPQPEQKSDLINEHRHLCEGKEGWESVLWSSALIKDCSPVQYPPTELCANGKASQNNASISCQCCCSVAHQAPASTSVLCPGVTQQGTLQGFWERGVVTVTGNPGPTIKGKWESGSK